MNLATKRKRTQQAGLKRGISLLLVICMIMSFTPLGALAQTATEADIIIPASSVIVMDETELIDEINAGTAVITLGTDVYVSGSNLVIPTGVDITLEGNFILSRADNTTSGNFITIETGAGLTIDGVRIESPAGVTGLRGILVDDGAALTLLDGNISGFDVSDAGGGVSVMGGTFEMYGGTISGNAASSGGGIYIESGSFEMYGGTISGNTAGGGGGLWVTDSGLLDTVVFTMWGGEISGNTASDHGGGVYYVGRCNQQ